MDSIILLYLVIALIVLQIIVIALVMKVILMMKKGPSGMGKRDNGSFPGPPGGFSGPPGGFSGASPAYGVNDMNIPDAQNGISGKGPVAPVNINYEINEEQFTAGADDVNVELDKDVIELFMSGVDVVSAVSINGGTEAFLDLIDLFYTDGMQRTGTLEERIKTKDLKNYVVEVHGLKSAAANIGANELSAIAKRHEDAGNASDYTYITENKEELFSCYNNVLAEIKRVLQQQKFGQFAEKEVKELIPLEAQDMLDMIKEALEQLESFHSKEAGKGVAELLEHVLPDDVRKRLEDIQGLLKMYEDDKAEEMLGELIESLN